MLTLSNVAFATGGTNCSVENDEIKINVNLTNGRIFGNPIVSGSTAEVRIKKNGLTVGIEEYTFKKSYEADEIPYWFNVGKELRLGAYAEPDTDSEGNPLDMYVSLSLVINAKQVRWADGRSYKGTYTVTQVSSTPGTELSTKTFKGKIRCEGE